MQNYLNIYHFLNMLVEICNNCIRSLNRNETRIRDAERIILYKCFYFWLNPKCFPKYFCSTLTRLNLWNTNIWRSLHSIVSSRSWPLVWTLFVEIAFSHWPYLSFLHTPYMTHLARCGIYLYNCFRKFTVEMYVNFGKLVKKMYIILWRVTLHNAIKLNR